MKKIFFTLIYLLTHSFCFSQEAEKIKYYTEKVEKYLDKEKALSGYYSIDKDGIKMFASPEDKKNNKTEFSLPLDQIYFYSHFLESYSSDTMLSIYKKGFFYGGEPGGEQIYTPPRKIISDKKLSGYKIAIDAGHIAGDLETGEMEKKHVKFKKDSLHGLTDSIDIAEGMITYATAKLLKDKLEADGAQVFMTRTANGYTAFGETFSDWLKKDYSAAVDTLFKIGKISRLQKDFFSGKKARLNDKVGQASDRDKFRVIFKDLELQKRGEIINEYNPDITVIIHYNVDETNTGWVKPGNKDFNMTFVGGAFMKGDLVTIEKRFEFLRLLISYDLENSIQLSSSVVKSFESTLKVPIANQRDAKYLMEGCLPTTEKGVYCRNLQLTRYVHSPLVYGETLYQDNINECKLLNKETDKTKNERVQQVAEAYYQGILNYFKK